MSIKNDITNKITKTLITKADDDKMIDILAKGKEEVKYRIDGYRILNKIDKNCVHNQFFYKGIRFEEVRFSKNLRMEEVNSALLKKDTNLEKVILFFHGGGFIGKLNSIYSNLMYKLCKQLPDYKIIAVEYRTLREHIFPDALNDSIIAWEYLMSEKYNPNNIIILGDSAGGNLGLALTMYLRDCGIFPKAYIGLSPWVNLDMDAIENIEKKSLDPLFGSNNVLSILGKMYAGDYDIKDWKVSPFYGDFKNLPKMFLSYGSLEILGDDIQALYEKAKDEVDIVLKVYNKCQHDVITSETKEGKIALNDVVDFINSL